MSWLKNQSSELSSMRPELEQLETRNLLSHASQVVADQIVHSAENYGNYVEQSYERYLGRTADPAGFTGWVQYLERGGSPESVEASFVASVEYQEIHGSNFIGWLTALYQDLLGRAPDAAGLNGWLNALATGMSPYQIALAFSTSTEREAMFITADYVQFLGRTPDAAGMDGWLNVIENGGNREDIAVGIVGSDEYFAVHGDNDADFVIASYEDILLRDPSAAELDAWVTAMGLIGP
jgi:hypothetical protein